MHTIHDFLGMERWVRAEAKAAYGRRERDFAHDLLAVAEAMAGPGTENFKKKGARTAPSVAPERRPR